MENAGCGRFDAVSNVLAGTEYGKALPPVHTLADICRRQKFLSATCQSKHAIVVDV